MFIRFSKFGSLILGLISGFALRENNNNLLRLKRDSDISYKLKKVFKNKPSTEFKALYGEISEDWHHGLSDEERKDALYILWGMGIINVSLAAKLPPENMGLIDEANGFRRVKIKQISDDEEQPILRQALNDDIVYLACIRTLRLLSNGAENYDTIRLSVGVPCRDGLEDSDLINALALMGGVRFSLISFHTVFISIKGRMRIPVSPEKIKSFSFSGSVSGAVFFKKKPTKPTKAKQV